MSFGFRVGVPGMSVRVSNRGVRTSVGPRGARLTAGSGGARVSSSFGPFYASSSLGGTRRRAASPSPTQLERARKQAERAQQAAERDALIAQLTEMRRQMTSVHLDEFWPTRRPQLAPPPPVDAAWALRQAEEFHLAGVGRFARAERAAARQRAEVDACAFAASEQARQHALHGRLVAEGEQWWAALIANEEDIVCEAVNVAFADNPAAGCAVGVTGAVLSVVIRQPDIDSLPAQMPGFTAAGRPTLKNVPKRERTLWWLQTLGANVVAALREAFATAPAITAIDLAVISRIPATQQLGFVAYGHWTRAAIESTPWRTPDDALRFLDLGTDVACAVNMTGTGTIKALDVTPSLAALLAGATDEDAESADHPAQGAAGNALGQLDAQLSSREDPSAPTPDIFALRPFAEWFDPRSSPGQSSDTWLTPGQTVVVGGGGQLRVEFTFGGADADLSLFLLEANGLVSGDADFLFYGQPTSANGAVRLLGKSGANGTTMEHGIVDLDALPLHVERIAIGINMDVETGLTCAALRDARLRVTNYGAGWLFSPQPDPALRAMVVAELYRRDGWKLRAIGQGWADGLGAMAEALGVQVDSPGS
ncbi:TerD family protein [Nocardia camponoti]|uniref:TerD domain-containing protein n=1 Tax=Nocardia camponoti TaxID=1616106 RepID=A0A917VE88_9NOCA|nr:TerD family protein [Nocardia camponoti]GGK66974.1 hypothetical protein GCM10011591_43900 [Nocardia camponoti]